MTYFEEGSNSQCCYTSVGICNQVLQLQVTGWYNWWVLHSNLQNNIKYMSEVWWKWFVFDFKKFVCELAFNYCDYLCNFFMIFCILFRLSTNVMILVPFQLIFAHFYYGVQLQSCLLVWLVWGLTNMFYPSHSLSAWPLCPLVGWAKSWILVDFYLIESPNSSKP